MTLLEQFEALRANAYSALTDERGSLGQFYTPASIASSLASLVEKPLLPVVSLIDPGAGVGMLSAAAAMHLADSGVREINLTVCEIAPEVLPFLRTGLVLINDWCVTRDIVFHVKVIEGDFIEWAARQVSDDLFATEQIRFDLAILNPPYKKIPTDSLHRQQLRRVGVECTNLYAAFVYLSARLLRDNGQLVSINPRSFANGPYFRDFRQQFFSIAPLHTVHVFKHRNSAFASDNVLQENVIIHAKRGTPPSHVRIVSSEAGETSEVVREVPMARVISADDPDQVLHLEATAADADVSDLVRSLPATLSDIGVQVSTGRVVDYRAKDGLKTGAGDGCVPLIYPQHLRGGTIEWPKHAKKPDYFYPGDAYASQLIPAGTYVLTKRFSSKEEKRRISAALITKENIPATHYAVENHVNYFHASGGPLEQELAVGLTAYLNSTLVDSYFRLYNGHTQVNATDLRALRYPSPSALRQLGQSLSGIPLITENVDQAVIKLCRQSEKKEDQGGALGPPGSRHPSRAA